MPIDPAELDRRLADAARARLALRLATREWQALGRSIRSRRHDTRSRLARVLHLADA